MSFEYPGALLFLLLALPLTWYIGFPRYKFRRRRDVTALLLRSTIIICLLLAIAGIQWVQVVDKLAVIFLVDVSDSMGTELQEAQLDYIREAVIDKPIDDEWALLVFGENPLPETAFNALRDVPEFQSNVRTGNTDIAEAIQTAISLFPGDARRRIVILSDGQETLGSAEVKAQLAEASGIEISYVPFYRDAVTDT
ncbi:MAG: vWA domain-containing protein, partial [Aggregatilineales bacterium]